MNANHVESKFAMMGARLKVSVLPEQRVSKDYAVDIQRDRHGEYFERASPTLWSSSIVWQVNSFMSVPNTRTV